MFAVRTRTMVGYFWTFVLPKAHPTTLIKNEIMTSRAFLEDNAAFFHSSFFRAEAMSSNFYITKSEKKIFLKGFKVSIESI